MKTQKIIGTGLLMLISLLAVPYAAAGDSAVTVEGNTIYANGTPIVVKKDVDESIYVYSRAGEKLCDQPVTPSTIYGGSKNADVQGNTYVEIEDLGVTVYGGGYSDGSSSANVMGDTTIIVVQHGESDKNHKVSTVYGGGRADGEKGFAQANVLGKTNVTLHENRYDPPDQYGHAGSAHKLYGGGYAYATKFDAEANTGDVELSVDGVLQQVSGGGYASASGGLQAAAHCETVRLYVSNGDIGDVFGGGYASGAGAAADVEAVITEIKQSDTSGVVGGGHASDGGQANVAENLSLAFQDNAVITGNVYAGGYASGAAAANAGSVTLYLENSTVPAFRQRLGNLAMAFLYVGGRADGTDSVATVGDVSCKIQNVCCAGAIFGGGEISPGGQAACGAVYMEIDGLLGHIFENNTYLPTVIGGGNTSDAQKTKINSLEVVIKNSEVEEYYGGALVNYQPEEPDYPSKLLLGEGAAIGMQDSIHEIELIEDLTTAALPEFSAGEWVTLRGNGHKLTCGMAGGGTLTVENTVFQEKPLVWIGSDGETLQITDCMFENLQQTTAAIQAEANGGNIVLTGNTVQNGQYTSAVRAAGWSALTIQGNTLKDWQQSGYALDLENASAQSLAVSGNAWANTPEYTTAYLKLALADGAAVDLRKNYWNGLDPTGSAAFIDTANPLSVCQTEPYFKAITMRDPEDLSDYSAPSNNSGGSSNNNQQTVTNQDGSVTTTVTNPSTGVVTETTKKPDGSTTKKQTQKNGAITAEETRKDGSVCKAEVSAEGQVKIWAELSERAVEKAVEENNALVLPVADVQLDAKEEPELQVLMPSDGKPVRVMIPLAEPSAGTVALLVEDDGKEEVLRKSVLTETGIQFSLEQSATIKIVDNSVPFTDVPEQSWCADAVAFVSSRELFRGAADTRFVPDDPMTRGMLAAVLYRLENEPGIESADSFADIGKNAYFTQGVVWAAQQGIVNGFPDGSYRPDGNISREQLAVILYRYAGSPVPPNLALMFEDADRISGYADAALRWATEQKIFTGKPGNRLDPQGAATRAEVAIMLQRYMQSAS